ncbi:MAG: nitroreductase family protein [Candidatus Hadarchaeales archaeon]
MDTFEAIRGRRSIRSFREDPVSEGDLQKILEAGILAPSAGNCQPWDFIVVKSRETKEKLSAAALGQEQVVEAPVVIVVCANTKRSSSRYGRRGAELYCIQDTAAAVENMMLAAHALGYGSCWVGAFEEEKVARIVGAPAGVRPVAIIPIGRPAEKPRTPPRLPLSQVVHEERF